MPKDDGVVMRFFDLTLEFFEAVPHISDGFSFVGSDFVFWDFLHPGFGCEVGPDLCVVGPFERSERAFAQVGAGFDFCIEGLGQGVSSLNASAEIAGDDFFDSQFF